MASRLLSESPRPATPARQQERTGSFRGWRRSRRPSPDCVGKPLDATTLHEGAGDAGAVAATADHDGGSVRVDLSKKMGQLGQRYERRPGDVAGLPLALHPTSTTWRSGTAWRRAIQLADVDLLDRREREPGLPPGFDAAVQVPHDPLVPDPLERGHDLVPVGRALQDEDDRPGPRAAASRPRSPASRRGRRCRPPVGGRRRRRPASGVSTTMAPCPVACWTSPTASGRGSAAAKPSAPARFPGRMVL